MPISKENRMKVEEDEFFSLEKLRHGNVLAEFHKQVIEQDGEEICVFVIGNNDVRNFLLEWFFLFDFDIAFDYVLLFLLVEEDVGVFMFLHPELCIFLLSSKPFLFNSVDLRLLDVLIVKFKPLLFLFDEGIVVSSFWRAWVNYYSP